MKTYSKEEIRKRLMQYHNIDGNKQLSGLEGVREIMKRLGSIQYDPLNVVGQNADLVLQARVDNYSPNDLYINNMEVRKKILLQLVEKDAIETFQIDGFADIFYACKDFFTDSVNSVQKDYSRFIAPLDNVIWDRAMLERVFDFAYSWEVYTPVVKRRFGYYVIPVVYNNRFVARFEPEAVSKSGSFAIKNWWWETEITPDDKMRKTILKEMSRFSEYLKVECNKDNIKKIE